MERKDRVGKSALFLYEDNAKTVQCFGRIVSEDESFFSVQTSQNLLLIPKTKVCKVKMRNGEIDERK